MQRNNLTISAVASKAKIDRTLLSKAISGSRSLNRVTFKKLLSAIEPTYHELEMLTELYAISYFGESSYNRIQLLIKHLQNTPKAYRQPQTANSSPMQWNVNETEDYRLLYNINDTQSCIRYIISNEWKSEHPKLYSNFPYNSEYINSIFFALFEKNTKHADFKHLICFSPISNKNEELKAIFQAIEYQNKGYATNYYICGDKESFRKDTIFPYYIISSDSLIIFNNDLTKGLLIKEPEIINQYCEIFHQIIIKCAKIVTSVEQISDFREILLPYCTNTYELLHFGNLLSRFITEETIHLFEYDHNDMKAASYLQNLCDINSHILSDFNFYTFIMYKDELTDFLYHGKISTPLKKSPYWIPDQNKSTYLTQIFNFMKKKNVHFCITNSKMSVFANENSILLCKSDIYKNNIVFINQIHEIYDKYTNNCIAIHNDTAINTYCNFFEYLNLFSYTETPEVSLDFLEKELNYTKKSPQIKSS